MQDLLTAIALLLVIEGIMPFLLPTHWRKILAKVITQSDKILRIFGFISMGLGMALLYGVRSL